MQNAEGREAGSSKETYQAHLKILCAKMAFGTG